VSHDGTTFILSAPGEEIPQDNSLGVETAGDRHLKKVILVGNSLGGHVAILYTHRCSGNVQRLVLTGSSGLYENTGLGSYPKRSNYTYIHERVAYTFYDPAVATEFKTLLPHAELVMLSQCGHIVLQKFLGQSSH
jgi:pimeloyl-ACP methyl ester carboxylesterase